MGARTGMAVEKGEEGSALLLYAEAACPGFLERRPAGRLELGFTVFRWGSPTVSKSLFIADWNYTPI